MNVSVFNTYLQVDPEAKWTESSNCHISNLLDSFRDEEEDCDYIYTICDNNIAVALPVSYIYDGENGLYFIDTNTDECKHIQNHKFHTFIQKIKLHEE